MTKILKKIQILDSTSLKIIAIISMTIDHMGYVFFDNNSFLRAIGRIAMPIFSFFIAEGYRYTGSKKKYLTRLGIFALISEIPFDLCFFGKVYFRHQNIMFTFFISVLALILFDLIRGKKDNDKNKYDSGRTVLAVFVVGIIGIISSLLGTDYGILAVISVLIFYITEESEQWGRAFYGSAFLSLTQTKSYYVCSGLAFFPLIMYNGKKGKGMKWFFYVFYPAHLLILFLISTFIVHK